MDEYGRWILVAEGISSGCLRLQDQRNKSLGIPSMEESSQELVVRDLGLYS